VWEDVEAIKKLKARYERCVDVKDWVGFRQVFTDDVVWDTRSTGARLITGADEVTEFVKSNLDSALCVHHCHMPEIELLSPTTAEGVWASEDVIRWPDGTQLHGWGHYYETYEKVDGKWRIKTLRFDEIRADFTQTESEEMK
jgi:hypothetical protein